MANFYVGEVLFETGGTIDTPGDINVTSICDCSGSTGTAGQLLSSTGTALLWTNAGAPAIPCSILTTKGDIVVASAPGTPTALPVGSNGYILAANSACSTGLEWVANSAGDVTSVSGTAPITVDNTNPQTPVVGVALATTGSTGVVSVGTNINVTAGGAISVPAATTSSQGAVQIGTNINVSSGTISVPAATTTSQGAVQVGTNLSVTSGTISVPAATTTSQGAVQVGTNIDVTSGTISVPAATTTNQGAVQVGTNIQVSSGTISVLSATTAQQGVVQLNDTTASSSTTEALTAAQGKNLQDQIDALAITSNITLAGTLDTATGNLITVTTAGAAAGFTVASPLPAAASGNAEYFVIVTVAATSYTPPGGTATQTHVGDWFLSSGTAWDFLDVGFDPPYASTTAAGVVELSTDAETQAGTDATLAVTPASAAATYVPLADYTTKGDILAATGSSTPTALPVGTNGQILYANSACASGLEWGTQPITCLDFDAKGDLLAGAGADSFATLGVGTNGQILYACSTAATGLCWSTPPAAAAAATPVVAGIVLGCTNATLSALGCNALLSNTSGLRNTAAGFEALCANLTGNDNTAFGFCSGRLITGNSNTLIGSFSGRQAAAASGNVGLGRNTLCSLISGGSNTAIGADAMLAVGTGQLNTALGSNAFGSGTGSLNVALGAYAGCNLTTGSANVAIGCGVTLASATGNCQLSIGFGTGCNWLTGNSTKAIQPGAGIIDCAGSCGTAGQVLMSNGSNAICWGSAGGGGSGTVTSITAGTGLTGGTITTSGTIALDTACVIQPTALTAKGSLITATAASTPTALGVGTDGQVLTACTACSSGLVWATPPSVYQTTSSSSYSFTTGVPVSILNFGDSNSVIDMTLFTTPQGTVSVVWKAVKAGDPTNYNTGWNPYFSWPVPSLYNPGSLAMLSPVYPDPLAGNMILYYTPAATFTSRFTLVYAAMLGAAPTWMI